MHALTEAPRPRAGGSRRLPAAPGSRPEDSGAHLDAARDHVARRAAERRRGGPAARSLRNGRAQRGEDPEGARGGRRRQGGGASAPRSARSLRYAAWSPSSPRIRRRSRCRRRAASARRRETVRDLDLIATSTDPPALDRARSATATGSRRSLRAATRRRRSSVTTVSASTSGWCRRSATATCSSTSRARRTTTSRCARTLSAVGCRSPSTASRRSRAARS